MTGAVGNNFAQQLFSEQSQIADQIQHFVAHELVGEAQGGVFQAVPGQHNAIVARGAANQTHIAHGLLILTRTECAGSRDVFEIASVRQLDLECFFSNEGMGKIDRIRDRVGIGGVDGDEFVALAHFQAAANLQIFTRPSLFSDPNLLNHLDEWFGAAVQNRQFKIIEFDDGIVDSCSDKSRKHVFGGGNQNALFHQAGGVADTRDVAADSFDLESVEVRAAKDDTCS